MHVFLVYISMIPALFLAYKLHVLNAVLNSLKCFILLRCW